MRIMKWHIKLARRISRTSKAVLARFKGLYANVPSRCPSTILCYMQCTCRSFVPAVGCFKGVSVNISKRHPSVTEGSASTILSKCHGINATENCIVQSEDFALTIKTLHFSRPGVLLMPSREVHTKQSSSLSIAYKAFKSKNLIY
jgi:hypothetical protein